jgi:hypothetical protein
MDAYLNAWGVSSDTGYGENEKAYGSEHKDIYID